MNASVSLVLAALTAGLGAGGLALFLMGAGARVIEKERTRVRQQGDQRTGNRPFRLLLSAIGAWMAGHGWRAALRRFHVLAGQAGVLHRRSAEELLGTSACTAWVGAGSGSALLGVLSGPAGAVAGLVLGAGLYYSIGSNLKAAAKNRSRLLLAQLPFSLDLMSLCVQAGGSLKDAVDAVIRTNPDSPLSQELATAQAETESGVSFSTALRHMAARVQQEEVDTFVDSFTQAEFLGVPLNKVLRNLADVSRTRRYERADEAVSASTTKMLGPSMLIMMAVLLVFLFPILLAMGTRGF